MAGIVNDVLYALNADFTGGNSLLASENNGLITNGQMWIGSTALNAGGTHINVGAITSPNNSLVFGYISPNITADIRGGASGTLLQGAGLGVIPTYTTATYPSTAGTSGNVLTSDGTNFVSSAPISSAGTITGNTGGALSQTAGNWNIVAGANAGTSVKFNGSASTLSLNFTDGQDNIFIGRVSGSALPGPANVGVGTGTLQNINTGQWNSAVGFVALNSLTSGERNNSLGYQSLVFLTTGTRNVAIGYTSGIAYTSSESNNVLIQNDGVTGESGKTRIGNANSNACFIAGITGVTVASSAVTTCDANGQLGTDTTNFTILTTGLQLKGNGANTAPPAGFIGEEIKSVISFASAVTSTTTTVTNVTSIALTAGIWDISGLVMYTGMTTASLQRASINTTSATHGTLGDNQTQSVYVSTTAGDVGLVVPSWRLLTTGASTTVYLVASGTYTVGTGKLYGRISAIRAG